MKYLTIKSFAEEIGVTEQTLRNWDKTGKLKPHHRTPSGYRMYSTEQVEIYFLNGVERGCTYGS